MRLDMKTVHLLTCHIFANMKFSAHSWVYLRTVKYEILAAVSEGMIEQIYGFWLSKSLPVIHPPSA